MPWPRIDGIIIKSSGCGNLAFGTVMPVQNRSICAESVRMALEKNQFERLGNIVFAILERAILSSELAPGTRLNVAKLAGELEVSVTPVREAIELCSRGLVRAEQKGDGRYSNYYVFDMDNRSIANLFVARKSVEGMAAYICAEKNWLVDMAELGRIAGSFQRAVKAHLAAPEEPEPNVYLTAGLDMDFHGLLVRATRNEYLISMYEAISKKIEYLSIRTNQFMAGESNADNLLLIGSQHISIYRAVRQGFPEVARSIMEKHIDFCASTCLQNRNLMSG